MGMPVRQEVIHLEPVIVGAETLYRKVTAPMRGPVAALSDPIIIDFAKLHDHFRSFLTLSLPTNRHFLHYNYIKEKIQAILNKHGDPFSVDMIIPWALQEEKLYHGTISWRETRIPGVGRSCWYNGFLRRLQHECVDHAQVQASFIQLLDPSAKQHDESRF
jgi:hypothetical protein